MLVFYETAIGFPVIIYDHLSEFDFIFLFWDLIIYRENFINFLKTTWTTWLGSIMSKNRELTFFNFLDITVTIDNIIFLFFIFNIEGSRFDSYDVFWKFHN